MKDFWGVMNLWMALSIDIMYDWKCAEYVGPKEGFWEDLFGSWLLSLE